MYLLLSLFAFGLLVLVHEFGHFIVAKMNGVKVEEFSIGMGPRIFSRQGKSTLYSLKALPIGGSVKMFGENDEEEGEGSFLSKRPLQKMSIIAAGPLMNVVMAVFILFIITLFNGYSSNQVREVLPDSPALAAGIQTGDEIIEINGQRVWTFEDVTTYIAYNGLNPVEMKVRNDSGTYVKNMMPMRTEEGRVLVGISPYSFEDPGFFESIGQSFRKGASLINQTFFSLRILFTGNAGMDDFGGPITIFRVSSEVASVSLWAFASFVAFLSINLAILNLIPFPALDGGWLVILTVELLSKRKLPEKFVGIWNTFGFVVLMSFMLLITFKDIFFPVRF